MREAANSGGPSAEAVTLFPYADEEVDPDCRCGSPGPMTLAADQIEKSAQPMAEVESTVATEMGKAVNEVNGDIQGPIVQLPSAVVPDARMIKLSAYVSAGIIRRFAESVRRFNGGKDDLRVEYDQRRTAIRASTLNPDDAAGPSPSAPAYDQQLAEVRADLEPRQAKLRRTLAAEADEVARLLRAHSPYGGGDDKEALRELYAQGYVSDSVHKDLPWITLAKLPSKYARHSDEELVKLLRDPDLALDLREQILAARPDLSAVFSQGWSLSQHGQAEGGIIGPDGHYYPVSPEECTDRNGRIVSGEGTWRTVAEETGTAVYGRELPFGAGMLAGAIGGGVSTSDRDGWQSAGIDQGDYVRVGEHGGLRLSAEVDGDDSPTYLRPPSGPDPVKQPPVVERIRGGADLVVGAAEGLAVERQYEANRQHTTHVVFQTDEDGDRRAIIYVNQVQSDGEDLRLAWTRGGVTSDGSIVPIEHDAYGRPLYD